MIRTVAENVLLFLMPTAIYLAYAYLRRQDKGAAAGSVWDDAPLIWLFVIGAAMVFVTLLVFGSTSGGKPGQTYQPPVYRDGKIVPGEIK
jgi:hypothetical protein